MWLFVYSTFCCHFLFFFPIIPNIWVSTVFIQKWLKEKSKLIDMTYLILILRNIDIAIFKRIIIYLGLRLCGGSRIGFEELAKEHFNSDAALGNWSCVVVSILEWYWDSCDVVEERKIKHTKIVICRVHIVQYHWKII